MATQNDDRNAADGTAGVANSGQKILGAIWTTISDLLPFLPAMIIMSSGVGVYYFFSKFGLDAFNIMGAEDYVVTAFVGTVADTGLLLGGMGILATITVAVFLIFWVIVGISKLFRNPRLEALKARFAHKTDLWPRALRMSSVLFIAWVLMLAVVNIHDTVEKFCEAQPNDNDVANYILDRFVKMPAYASDDEIQFANLLALQKKEWMGVAKSNADQKAKLNSVQSDLIELKKNKININDRALNLKANELNAIKDKIYRWDGKYKTFSCFEGDGFFEEKSCNEKDIQNEMLGLQSSVSFFSNTSTKNRKYDYTLSPIDNTNEIKVGLEEFTYKLGRLDINEAMDPLSDYNGSYYIVAYAVLIGLAGFCLSFPVRGLQFTAGGLIGVALLVGPFIGTVFWLDLLSERNSSMSADQNVFMDQACADDNTIIWSGSRNAVLYCPLRARALIKDREAIFKQDEHKPAEASLKAAYIKMLRSTDEPTKSFLSDAPFLRQSGYTCGGGLFTNRNESENLRRRSNQFVTILSENRRIVSRSRKVTAAGRAAFVHGVYVEPSKKLSDKHKKINADKGSPANVGGSESDHSATLPKFTANSMRIPQVSLLPDPLPPSKQPNIKPGTSTKPALPAQKEETPKSPGHSGQSASAADRPVPPLN